jgi:hypothetical protein
MNYCTYMQFILKDVILHLLLFNIVSGIMLTKLKSQAVIDNL